MTSLLCQINTLIAVPVLLLLLVLTSVGSNRLAEVRTVDDYLNMCPISKYHKKEPSPERFLHNECGRYQGRSCCHWNTSIGIYLTSRWHGMSYDHCPHHVMGIHCREIMLKELCFYECSPNLGPWLVKVNQTMRKERPYAVPLCKQQCDRWWAVCKKEYTCVRNWGRGFAWYQGHNFCPSGSFCEPISQKFNSSEDFCESVWDGGYKVVDDRHACFTFDFDPSGGNPNQIVAVDRAFQILGSGNRRSVAPSIVISSSLLALIFVFS